MKRFESGVFQSVLQNMENVYSKYEDNEIAIFIGKSNK
jgi:hypothetical protein